MPRGDVQFGCFEVQSLDHKKSFSSPVTFLSRDPGKCFVIFILKKYLGDYFWGCPFPGMENKVVVIVEIKTWSPRESVMRIKSCSYKANLQQVWEEDWGATRNQESSGWEGHSGSHFEGAFCPLLRSLLWLLGQVPGKTPEGSCPL